MTARPDSRIGTDLGPYRIEAVLGRGGMGVVYLAAQRELGRKVALKLLPDELAADADFRARFERESHLAAAIDHPNIIPLYEAGEIDGVVFIAMRYVEGTDLASRLRQGLLATDQAWHILSQVAKALDAAHARGLVHRDVKPANVLLDAGAGEGGDHAYLTDFGLTKQAGSESGLTKAGSFLGTLGYMAPEQIDGREVDGRADQYSLAAMAFEALTGQVPFRRDQEIAVAMAHLKEAPPSAVTLRPDLAAGVDAVLARGLAKDPAARYESCTAFVADLHEALGGATIAIGRPADKRRVTAFVAIIGVGLVAAIGGGLLLGGGGSGRPSPSPSGPNAALAATSKPSPSASPSPTSTAFPTAQEAAFIAKLPDSMAACERVTEKEAATLAGLNRRVTLPNGQKADLVFDQSPAVIRLRCAVDPSLGAEQAFVFWDPRLGGSANGFSATGPEWAPDTVMGWLAGIYKLTDGDCATAISAYGRWASAGRDRGRIGCRVSTTTGNPKAWIYWTDEQTHVYGWASAPGDDGPALHRWWNQAAPFIIPPSDS